MPYISEGIRNASDVTREGLYNRAGTPGVLNLQITKLCLEYLETAGKSYWECNDVIGALECCKLEFYRRLVAPYEDIKIKENGDVYYE
jgi:hypothetical protein